MRKMSEDIGGIFKQTQRNTNLKLKELDGGGGDVGDGGVGGEAG